MKFAAVTDIWPYPEPDRIEDERQERQRDLHESGECADGCPLCEEER